MQSISHLAAAAGEQALAEPGEVAAPPDQRSNVERARAYVLSIPTTELDGMAPSALKERLIANGHILPRTTLSAMMSKLGWETVRTSRPNYLGRGATFAYQRRDPREFWEPFSMEELRAWTEDLGDAFTDATLTKKDLIALIIQQAVPRPGSNGTVDMKEFMERRRNHGSGEHPPPKRQRPNIPFSPYSLVPLPVPILPPILTPPATPAPTLAPPPAPAPAPLPAPAPAPPLVLPPPAVVMPIIPRGMDEEETLEFVRMRVEIRKRAAAASQQQK